LLQVLEGGAARDPRPLRRRRDQPIGKIVGRDGRAAGEHDCALERIHQLLFRTSTPSRRCVARHGNEKSVARHRPCSFFSRWEGGGLVNRGGGREPSLAALSFTALYNSERAHRLRVTEPGCGGGGYLRRVEAEPQLPHDSS